MKLWSILTISGALACTLSIAAAATAKVSPPQEVIDFALLDCNGRYHHLRQTDAKAVVLFFTANGCPIARKCVPKLRSLNKKFQAEGVRFWMVDSNTGDDRASIQKEAREFNALGIPVLMDDSQGVAKMLEVKRTGTAVCIETHGWTVFYEGAVDDQFVEGSEKPSATENYLDQALTQFLAGKTVSQARTVARGCLISFEKMENLAYSKDVAPILQAKCFTCHSPGNIGPRKMVSYEKVFGISDMIQEVLLARRMPPWHADPEYGSFQNDYSLSLDQKRTLLRWVEQGAPRGEGDDPLTKAVPPNHDWALGKPDAIVALPSVQEVPATGVLDYRYIEVTSPFDHDVWVKGAVAKPGNTRVVHHIIVRVKRPGQGRGRNTQDDAFLLGWAPGSPEMFYPEGTGKLIPKGSVLEFEMHYTTSGREETDQSRIGIYLLPEKPRMVLKTRAAYDLNFEITPGNPSENTLATYVFKKDSLLFELSPHMHLRGSWFKFEALYPTGEKETLLSVPHYDFKWQHNYRLKEPKRIPAGTWVLCSGGFDNSARNPDNPNPKTPVHWGDQSFDEMFIGFMGVAEIPGPDSEPKPVAAK